MQVLTTQATFECPVCHKSVRADVVVPEPNWGAVDKMSDLTFDDQTEVICNHCNTPFVRAR